MDCEDSIISGRPYGGLAILWRKSLGESCKPIVYKDEKRIMSLEVSIAYEKYLFLNVYLPYCCQDNYDAFLRYLSKIDSLILEADTPYVYVLGDCNADVLSNQVFGQELQSFCQEEGLILCDCENLSDNTNTYTYMSESHQSVSWLDHIVCTHSANAKVSSVNILDGLVSSDHFPLVITIRTPNDRTNSEFTDETPDEKDIYKKEW